MAGEYSTIREIREVVAAEKAAKKTVALVPTMGFLHEGHLELMRKAKQIADICIVSIFVNPTQFGPNEDLEKYPRDLEHDRALAKSVGIEYLFTPEVNEIYPKFPEPFSTFVDVQNITDCLCGKNRPGHFKGVATIVAKLFNIVEPDYAVFGEKDFQQLAVIRQMVSDLDFKTRIIGVPIVREPDGLAMSSRNTYLSDKERAAALVLSKAMALAQELAAGGLSNTGLLLNRLSALVKTENSVQIEYLEARDAESLVEIDSIHENGALIAIAARVGQTRLIDNTVVRIASTK
jgi:pantoate--beta-alanine ligase